MHHIRISVYIHGRDNIDILIPIIRKWIIDGINDNFKWYCTIESIAFDDFIYNDEWQAYEMLISISDSIELARAIQRYLHYDPLLKPYCGGVTLD